MVAASHLFVRKNTIYFGNLPPFEKIPPKKVVN